MTDDWDFYPCRVDGKPAFIYLDLGVARLLPMAAHPFMVYLSLAMRAAREDGLSSNDEYDALIDIEDALSEACKDGSAIYVGRCTTNGTRDFYFYANDNTLWQTQLRAVMLEYPGYSFEMGGRHDAEWRTYHQFLFPSKLAMRSIQDRRVCSALERNGDKLETAREIDHWAQFPDATSRDHFLTKAQALSFSLRAPSECDDDGTYMIRVWRLDVPSYSEIENITLPLFELAREQGGRYDGWECAVIRAE